MNPEWEESFPNPVDGGPKTEPNRPLDDDDDEEEESLGPNRSEKEEDDDEEEPPTCFAFSIWWSINFVLWKKPNEL